MRRPRVGKRVMGPAIWVRAAPKRSERTRRLTSQITGDYSLCSVGFDTRLVIDIKFNGRIIGALFDPGSCCTYLGKRALDKFPEVQIRFNLSTTACIVYPNGLVENTTGEAVMIVEINEVNKPLEVHLAPTFYCECIFGIKGAYEYGFQVNYGLKQWRLSGQGAHPFFKRRIKSPRSYVSSLGFDERKFITIKIRGQNIKILFDLGSCRTYLGGPALDKFPGMLRQAKKVFQVDYGSKYWRFPGLPIHTFKEEGKSENRKIGSNEPLNGLRYLGLKQLRERVT